MAQAAETAMLNAGIKAEDVDWLVPHQANIRIIDGVAERFAISRDRVIVTVDHHGNTSAASIPLAISENMRSGKLKKGDVVVMTAMGAGFTWGGAVVRL